MQTLNPKDSAFMVTAEKRMRHGCENVPDYMISGSYGDFTGVGDIRFFYSGDEALYGALPDFEEACKRANAPYTALPGRRGYAATVCCRSSERQRRNCENRGHFEKMRPETVV